MANTTLDVDFARAHFPALATRSSSDEVYVFADNAGGSQCLATVAASISSYLLTSNVQLGADYSVSVTSTARVNDGVEAARQLFNAESVGEIVLGSSSSLLVENLSRGLEDSVKEGDEIIVTGEHESNAGPWKRLAKRKGAVIKLWAPTITNPSNPYAVSLSLAGLLPLLTARTRLLALTACSNILGSVTPVADIVKAARAKVAELGGSRFEICLDCVAYAPHRRMDVRAWDVDFAYFSWYKVYGPHTSALYARLASLKALSSIQHDFLAVSESPYKLQPGGPGYELVYGCTAVAPYLRSLTPAGTLEAGFGAIKAHEQTLIKELVPYLESKYDRGVRLVGQGVSDDRVPTISFVVTGPKPLRSRDVVAAFDKLGWVGIRYGHFYAYTLVSTLQPPIDPEDGVVRISLVHYNTIEEVRRIIQVLETVLGA